MIELYCCKCDKEKSINDFSTNNTIRGAARYNRSGWCKECHREYYKSKNPLKPRKTFEDRFWDKVIKRNGCWEWKGGTGDFGYGTLWKDGENEGAHRISWMIHFGDIPKDMHVLHKCDNPPCNNPDHLFLGNPDLNAKDRVKKGRSHHPKGSIHPQTELNEDDVLRIRFLYKIGRSQMSLAREYGMSQGGIGHIIHRRRWNHI